MLPWSIPYVAMVYYSVLQESVLYGAMVYSLWCHGLFSMLPWSIPYVAMVYYSILQDSILYVAMFTVLVESLYWKGGNLSSYYNIGNPGHTPSMGQNAACCIYIL